ncbi:MAG: hypothetical protein ACLFVP_04765 [Candidatus Bathyarchaeia archaeon]
MSVRSALAGLNSWFKIAIKAPSLTLQWYTRRRKAKKVFREELVRNGVPNDEAKSLADDYPFKIGDLLNLAWRSSDH